MIKVNESEYKSFYTKAIDDENSVTVNVPIDGYTMNKNVACTNCKFFKRKDHHYEGGYSPIEEICTHKENVHYTYDYKGKHSHTIWEPQDKNKRLDCELYEKKVPIMQKIKIRLGIM